ncbi:MAG TPA: cysteine--tRNA ligase [Candidatus Thermoplasmatota archaeon]|nr:cysteine--tRNA ligase [Candidatus Thermoplasmatota archaeon]
MARESAAVGEGPASLSRLRVMNTLTHRKEPFQPREPGHVRMYVCGPSVYDEAHLGHARSYVAYDAMKRYFLACGRRVTHVQNFTDVEENIAARARQRGMQPLEWADHLVRRFFEDMDALLVLRADHYPRVSEHIPEIQRIVAALVEKGQAYTHDCGEQDGRAICDVYFDSRSAADYGALIGTSVEELAVELPIHQRGERRHPLDFALWKSRDDWGIVWESTWGRGRPGWHVECTAMSTKYLGLDFDIHGGGLDLVFPHHENERVIGEAVSGQRYCRHYLHNGFVTVGSQKMSKSLGNFVTVRGLLAKHDPEVLRAFLLSQHYRAPLNYDEAAIEAAARRVERWRAASAKALAEGECPEEPAFWAALEDDFDFGAALAAIDRAVERGSATRPFLERAAAATGLLWSLHG